ncbi:MAG: PLP-dependent aminotransferase family protein [Verrucomicrobiota bacterium JB022]|nr:PLP-dependent aminotransferase family protein [Verrucomicrobiota bacterium JB022]
MRRAPHQDIALPPPRLGETWQRWLYRELRDRILAGQLPPGSRLPSTRNLARQHTIARGTVVAVYEQLALEGYVESKVGSGSVVASALAKPTHLQPPRIESEPSRRALPKTKAQPFPVRPEGHEQRAFRANQPALDAFPLDQWARLHGRVLRRLTARDLAGGDARGWEPLRVAVAGYLAQARGIQASPEQVFITSGTQQAFDLVARLLAKPGALAVMEEPGYVGATPVLQQAGWGVQPVPVDGQGLRVDALPRAANLCYVTPAHHFPTGALLGLERRLRLLEWARTTGAWIFEDDYDGEYRFDGRPVASLQSLDRDGVLYAFTFTKLLFPAIRLGCMVVPPALVEPLLQFRALVDRFPPVIEQAVLAEFIAQGQFAQHMRRMRELYAGRRALLAELAQAHWGERLRLETAHAGLQAAAWLPAGVDDCELVRALQEVDVEALPISTAYADPFQARHGLLLGFAAASEAELRRGAEAVARVLDKSLTK